MIRRAILVFLVGLGVARAAEAEGAGEVTSAGVGASEAAGVPPAPLPDDPVAASRMSTEELIGRAIGSASRPVVFNWRRTRAQVAVTGDTLFELNNFQSVRVGALGRFPSGGIITEVGASYVHTWDTPSSVALSFTPYRQPGRPDRMELDVNVGLPLAEGVVTVAPRAFPAVHLVFNAYAGLRYLLYPDAFAGMKAGKVASAILSPTLTDDEIANLDDRRLDAMQVDPARYGLTIGIGNDLYFKQGIFLSPRATFALPVLAPATETDLVFWGDVSLAVGFAR